MTQSKPRYSKRSWSDLGSGRKENIYHSFSLWKTLLQEYLSTEEMGRRSTTLFFKETQHFVTMLDEQLCVEGYQRTPEEDDEFGISDMVTEGYEKDEENKETT
mmetsp:Transcript_8849/g.13404  ORF Transcript_8849/g.13404 Transcript_8849/m.13404 type:complete len:103 (-) Transcript_8849:19-327(-)